LVEAVSFVPDVNVVRLLKALDNELRLKIVELVLNSSPVSFSAVHEHLEGETGRKINKGTVSYHLDILVRSNVLSRELERSSEDKTYSRYEVTDYANEKIEALGLLVPGARPCLRRG
jgi:DNA-binding transcriptional ArsR family regulator